MYLLPLSAKGFKLPCCVQLVVEDERGLQDKNSVVTLGRFKMQNRIVLTSNELKRNKRI